MTARATVEVLEGGSSRIVAVPRGGLRIGRAPEAGLIVTSRSVSAIHADLFWQGDDLFIADAGSSFGTRREGQAIREPTRIEDGDEVVLGGATILRFSIFGAGFGAPVSMLAETEGDLVPTEAPSDAQPFSIDLLPITEALFQAASRDDLGHRIAVAAHDHFHPSRVALLELSGGSDQRERRGRSPLTGSGPAGGDDRYRVLGTAGAAPADAGWVSRTVVAEAARRGVAHHATGSLSPPLASIVSSGASSAVAAGIRPRDGRVRVLYMDALLGAPRLTWGHAVSLQLFCARAETAFEVLEGRLAVAEDQRRFEQLRRYFSPAVVEHILSGKLDAVERPQNLHATVLFADLVGYTKLSERLRGNPGRLLGLLNRWLDAGAGAVLAHGGTLDKFIGDAVMAVFGAPFPAPDGELSAVRCALEMQAAVAAISVEMGEPLEITVGINSGDVLAGSVGSRRRLEYTVLGDTVNVAARLQGKSQPSQILVGPATAAAVWDHVELVDAGVLELKNHAPVAAFRVLGLRP